MKNISSYFVGLGTATIACGLVAFVLSDAPTSTLLNDKRDAYAETRFVFDIRQAQADYQIYIQKRMDTCKAKSQTLTRDLDGILTCVVPPVPDQKK